MAQIFPKWTNETPRLITLGTLAGGALATFALYWWASPYHTEVGYQPKQPVAYSHKLHAGKGEGELKMDCRYCHAYVEKGAHAGVPATQVCMNCHSQVKTDSPKLQLVRDSWDSGVDGKSIEWVRVHKLPDFAYFNHSAHLGVGTGENRAAIGCETCHGRIDTMEVVAQNQPLSMGWCLDCHSNPAPNLRPVENITTMGYTRDLAWSDKSKMIAATLNPPGSLSAAMKIDAAGHAKTYATAGCSGCHR
jgi:hypothetical protein